MLALCWHSTPANYAFYYAGIFDAGLIIIATDFLPHFLYMHTREKGSKFNED